MSNELQGKKDNGNAKFRQWDMPDDRKIGLQKIVLSR